MKFYVAGYDEETHRHFAETVEAADFEEAVEHLSEIGRQRFGGRTPRRCSVVEVLPYCADGPLSLSVLLAGRAAA